MRHFGENRRDSVEKERGGLPAEGRREDSRWSGTDLREGPRRDISPLRAGAAPPRRRCTTVDEIIEEYTPYAHTIVVKAGMEHEADTILQQVFIGVDRYLQKHPLPGELEGLIAAIAWRKIYDLLRTRYREHARADVDADTLPDSRRNPEQLLSLAERARAVHRALAIMPEKYAMLIRLVDLVGHSQREVATQLGCDENALRVRVGRARRMLYTILEPILGEDPGDIR
jgi:RNA polymerase sigma factor (sigma-70 family)